MRRSAAAVVLDVVGSAAVLVLLSLTWQTVRVHRGAPFADVAAGLSGRSLQPAAFGLALVTLAGAVAALATRGWARRVVGVVVTAAGVATALVCLQAVRAVADDRARTLVAEAVSAQNAGGVVVPLTGGEVAVAVRAAWPVLAAVAAVLVVAAGVLWTLRTAPAARGLGERYEAPRAAERPREATLWSALDHGEDPTATDADDAPDVGPTPGAPVVDASPDRRTATGLTFPEGPTEGTAEGVTRWQRNR